MKSIGILGGSFDPPHVGHMVMCLLALEAGGLDEVWMIPAFTHVLGKELSPYGDREAMCRLCAEPLGERVRVSDIEARRGGESRTLDTVESLIAAHPDCNFRLMVGADILGETHLWHRWERIAELAPPLVFARPGYPGGDLPAPPEVSSSEIRQRLAAGQSAQPLVSGRIMDYIERRGLYR